MRTLPDAESAVKETWLSGPRRDGSVDRRMREHELTSPQPARPSPSATPRAVARAQALQRAVGNRALARWAAHPDKDKKGVFLPDVVAADFTRFNPPKNE